MEFLTGLLCEWCRFAGFKKHLVAYLKKRQQAMQIRVCISDVVCHISGIIVVKVPLLSSIVNNWLCSLSATQCRP